MLTKVKNNLIESASHATGSLLIWDTGEYEVLPYRETRRDAADTDEDGNLQDVHVKKPQKTPSLLECFQDVNAFSPRIWSGHTDG